ncbi:GvpL/GvpF family gas vesicle protein [Plantactinospora sonchi]|uniref:GvpL/GvpF family gas vesicle protein n=1 Tax=Plantactinospora sonchi TaxID=1544735 RepID=A0ABU7RRL3_9ACTN
MQGRSRGGATATVEPDSGALLYGLVPGDVELVDGYADGLDEPVGPVALVRHGDVAALVSEVPLDVRLGRPEDLLAYRRLLDAIAVTAGVPVLPVRFGTVLANREAVGEALAARHDEYRAALADLDGRVEYVVHARYAERPLLSGILAEQPEAADLYERLRGQPADAALEARIRLGEIVHGAVEHRRASDTGRLVDTLAPYVLAYVPQPPRHEQEAARVAFLVDRSRRADFEAALAELADEWREWATVRLVGPAAAWDFSGPDRAG